MMTRLISCDNELCGRNSEASGPDAIGWMIVHPVTNVSMRPDDVYDGRAHHYCSVHCLILDAARCDESVTMFDTDEITTFLGALTTFVVDGGAAPIAPAVLVVADGGNP